MKTAVPPWIAGAVKFFEPTFTYTVIRFPSGINAATPIKVASTR